MKMHCHYSKNLSRFHILRNTNRLALQLDKIRSCRHKTVACIKEIIWSNQGGKAPAAGIKWCNNFSMLRIFRKFASNNHII